MAKAAKNVRLITEEIKAQGILNAENIDDGIILLESEGAEINLAQYIQSFDGTEVEISIKKKIEGIL